MSSIPRISLRLPELQFHNIFNFTKVKDRSKSAIEKLSKHRLGEIGNLKEITDTAAKAKISRFVLVILKICNFVIKIFNKSYSKIDDVLKYDALLKSLLEKYTSVIDINSAEWMQDISKFGDIPLLKLVHIGLNELHRYQAKEISKKLADLLEGVDGDLNNLIPKELRNIIENGLLIKNAMAKIEDSEYKETTVKVIQELQQLFTEQANNYAELATEKDEEKLAHIVKGIRINDLVLKELIQENHRKDGIYDVSFERLQKFSYLPDGPLTITMVSAEYTGLAKEGGLAEAVEGLSQGLKKTGNNVNLVFPKYSTLDPILKKLETELIEVTGYEYKVYKATIHGVNCYFLDDPSFKIEGDKKSIYGPDQASQAARFATFSKLTADFLYRHEELKTDVIHLHDWHACGAALCLKNDHPQEWENGKIPPIVFTYHNNNRCAQGRVTDNNPYTYDSIIKGFEEQGITKAGENLFVQSLMTVDAVTTVSKTFGIESQQAESDKGMGVSFAARIVAKIGKLTGILNGVNTDNWNPETNPSMQNWKDLKTNQPLDLNFGPDHEDLIERKNRSKEQLALWINEYLPESSIDPKKPIITYIGRFDAYQKGLDKFDEAIASTLKNGGQFICMGMGEDDTATEMLNALQTKYQNVPGVLFIRDFKDNGNLHYQQGDKAAGRPGMGFLVRAATDFVFVPSRFEPCGLVQFEGWVFGSLAIGSQTGGLVDSIITPKEDPDNFNGFLFDRDAKNSMSNCIKEALKFWKDQDDPVVKKNLIKRIIEDGRKYSWTTSPKGFSPVEQYLHVYESAIRKVSLRKASSPEFSLIEALKHKILSVKSQGSEEEQYYEGFYRLGWDSEKLDPLYRQLSTNEGWRGQFPSPYGRVNHKRHEKYGAIATESGIRFKVDAPKANEVILIHFDDDGKATEYPMQRSVENDWFILLKEAKKGQPYQYKINGQLKIDPYAKQHKFYDDSKKTPHSVVTDTNHEWLDQDWMIQRKENARKAKAVKTIEIHPTTWMKKDGEPLNYVELGVELVKQSKEAGFNQIELMGILEHPYEGSWGYQPLGFFAPTSRLGSVDDFKKMVQYLHQHNIGVILDFVPAQFASDDIGLKNFDGTNQFQTDAISKRKLFLNFGGQQFDFKKKEVREFLLSSAHYWIKSMHMDGLRIDCLSSLLGTEDPRTAELFIRDLNAIIHLDDSGAVSIAEDFSGDPRTIASSSTDAGKHGAGLDFDSKWNTAFMNAHVNYFRQPVESRTAHYELIKDALQNSDPQQTVFLSHDQFKSDGKSPFNLSKEDLEKRIADIKAQLSLITCIPSKQKLFWMGIEMGNSTHWDSLIGQKQGLMDSMDQNTREAQGILKMVKRINDIYTNQKAFYEIGNDNFKWIEDEKKKIHSYRRISKDNTQFACFHNLAGTVAKEITVSVPKDRNPLEIFNSDDLEFAGRGRLNPNIQIFEERGLKKYKITVPPLSTVVIEEKLIGAA